MQLPQLPQIRQQVVKSVVIIAGAAVIVAIAVTVVDTAVNVVVN